ncbi:MAG TPA: NAD(P)-dependent oxidoreductase [Rhizomicrobium sp.]|nr:NAD(P)-dependent oxidoreductase [Rhizomicrobium sp.]
MLPIALDPTALHIGLCGAGDGLARRRSALVEGGVSPALIDPEASLAGLNLLFVAGLDAAPSRDLARRAREQGVLVNVEDVPELCDFHMPAVVRRGDLTFTVSTNGKAPGLSRILREWLDRAFGGEWKERIDQVASMRALCRGQGLTPGEVSSRTRAFVEQNGWLA